MATKVAQKISETRATIEKLRRDLARHETRLEAFLELEAQADVAPRSKKPVEKPPSPPELFKSKYPWDKALAAIRRRGDAEFTTDDVSKALAALKSTPTGATVRDKLADMVKASKLDRISNGRYRFKAESKKEAA